MAVTSSASPDRRACLRGTFCAAFAGHAARAL